MIKIPIDKLNHHQIATMRPQDLLSHPAFWVFHQWKLLLMIVLNCFMLMFLWDYIFPVGESSASLNWLSGLILLILFIGLLWICIAVAKIEVEDAFAASVKRNTEEELGIIRSKQQERIILQSVRNYIPDNKSPQLAMPRLVEHIIKEAEDRKFDSSMIIMQPYREEAHNDIFKISGLQKAALQLGIVGTFIGLIRAFIELGASIDNIQSALHIIVDSLKYSFSTSIAGLIAAITIGLGVLLLLKERQEAYFRTMEEATDSLIALCRNAINKDVFLNSFEQMKETVDQVYKGVEHQTLKLQYQTDTISNGISSLAQTKVEFDGFLHHISKTEGDFISEMRNIYQILSPNRTSDELKKSLNDAVKGISESLNQNIVQALTEYKNLNLILEKMNHNMVQMEARLDQQNKEYEKHGLELRTLQHELYEYVYKLTIRQGEFVDKITGNQVSEVLINSVDNAGQKIVERQNTDLDRVVKNMNKLEQEFKYYNKLAKDELRQQTPYRALKTLVATVFILIKSSVLYLITIFKQLFSRS